MPHRKHYTGLKFAVAIVFDNDKRLGLYAGMGACRNGEGYSE